jgi:ABC-type branched-subunit amino acid transport system ATPase component
MRVNSLYIENLLTFDKFELRLDGGTHTVVGPNGSGKSNTARIFDLVTKALQWASDIRAYGRADDQVLRAFASAHHHGESQERPAIVRLGFALTTPLERLRMTTFIRAALLCMSTEEVWQGQNDMRLALSRWVEEEITEGKLQSLFVGTIVLRHVGLAHLPWDVSFEFVHENNTYVWDLLSRTNLLGIALASTAAARTPGAAPIQLRESMLKMGKYVGEQIKLPVPLPEFNLASLCPEGSDVITQVVVRIGSGSYDQSLFTFRRAIEVLGLPSEGSGQAKDFTLAYVLRILFNDGIIALGEQFRGLGMEGAAAQQAGPYEWETLVSPLQSRTPSMLPMRLFDLKNGDPSQRDKYQAIRKAFTELAPGRSFEVKFQALDFDAINVPTVGMGQFATFAPQDERDAIRPGASITIAIDRTRDSMTHPQDLPIQLHGAGTWEALVVAEALVESDGRFVILDEPALTLHPTWQRTVRSRIQDSESTFLIITHSADLVALRSDVQLSRILRFENESGETKIHRFPSDLSDEEASRIVQEFSLSTDAVSLLFARAVVLLEGETELGALPRWFENCQAAGTNRRPTNLDIAFYSVGGDRNFRTLIRVMDSLSIPWVLICDGAAFDVQKRNKNTHIFAQMLENGSPIPSLKNYLDSLDGDISKRVMDIQAFQDEKVLGEKHGAFTLAQGWTTKEKNLSTVNDERFEVFLDSVAPGMLAQAEMEVGNSKVRKGWWVAEQMMCPPEVNDLYQKLIYVLEGRGLSL